MKKRIIISVTCIAVAVIYVDAQNKSTTANSPVTATESFVAAAPPPPPVPPLPPVPPAPPSTDGIDLPLPPEPPAPPVPLAPPTEEITTVYSGVEIISSNGYEISVSSINGKAMVTVKKDGKTQKIKLSTWNANRKYYEKKYGQLPSPPPPVPVIEEVEFTPPVIKKDN